MAQEHLAATLSQKMTLKQEVAKLKKELEEKKKSLEVAEKEEKWLINRVKLGKEQKELLKKRLTEGWEDECSED